MKMRGRLVDITQDILNGGFQLRLAVGTIPSGVERLREESDLAISLKKWREHRSLSANAYYWVLVGKLSELTGQPNAVIHNMLLRRYGVAEIVGGQLLTVMVPDTDEAERETLEKEIYHLKPTSKLKEGKDGRMFRAYILLKGSSDFDTKEMARLIDGTVEEAKMLGLETLPEEEIERMMAAYEVNHTNGR